MYIDRYKLHYLYLYNYYWLVCTYKSVIAYSFRPMTRQSATPFFFSVINDDKVCTQNCFSEAINMLIKLIYITFLHISLLHSCTIIWQKIHYLQLEKKYLNISKKQTFVFYEYNRKMNFAFGFENII